MANPENLTRLNIGSGTWNEWRTESPDVSKDLTEADLSGKDLSGFDLRGVNLERANLRGAKLSARSLLCNANLSNSDLQDISFNEADLRKASFREANLRNADLSGIAGGLRTEQLAGADLTGAKLPDQLKKLYESLDNVKGISESARKIFLAVLAACLYCWLTIATTTDVNLITNRASSPLPIIQTSIPIVGFYVVAPLLVLCVYFYFHFYLQKLWEELGSLPAVFPDGRPLHAKVDPWLLNDLVRAHLPKLNVNRPFLSYFQLWISVLLAWWVVPITMLLFWGRYLRRHEQLGTMFHVVLLVISLVAAVCLYRLAVATLRGSERKPPTWKGTLTSRRGYLTAASTVAAGVLLSSVSWETRWAAPDSLVPSAMVLIGYRPFANLSGAEVSQKKANWEPRNYQENSVIGARLDGANLRYAVANGTFLAGATLLDANLFGAQLSAADLRGANLTVANLRDAVLSRADLRGGRLDGADLSDADLSDADLSDADLSKASLREGILDDANLGRTDLEQSDLRGASLVGTHLNSAILSGADLKDAELRDADLTGANLENADLRGADLRWADLTYAHLEGAHNLDPENVKKADSWDEAFYDDETLKALGLSRDHNEILAEQQEKQKKLRQRQNAAKPAPCAPPKQ